MRVVSPGRLARATEPPWAATIASTSERPRPAPPARVRAASPRTKRSKARGARSGGKPGPSSWTVKPVVGAGHRDGAAGGGVLAGVGQQVGDDLVQPRLVAGDGERRVGQGQPPLVVGVDDARVVDRLEQQPGQVDGLALERAARVEAGQQEQVLDQPGHPRRLGLHLVERGAGGLRAAAGELGVAGDRRQRRTQLVRGVRDELAHLLLAAVALVEGRLDVVEHRVERRADLADLGALVGEAGGHALGHVDLAGGEGELGDPVGGAGDLAQRRQLAAYDERAGCRGAGARRAGWRAARAAPATATVLVDLARGQAWRPSADCRLRRRRSRDSSPRSGSVTVCTRSSVGTSLRIVRASADRGSSRPAPGPPRRSGRRRRSRS